MRNRYPVTVKLTGPIIAHQRDGRTLFVLYRCVDGSTGAARWNVAAPAGALPLAVVAPAVGGK